MNAVAAPMNQGLQMTLRQSHLTIRATAFLALLMIFPAIVLATQPAQDSQPGDQRPPMAGPRPRPGDRIRNMDPQRRQEMRKRIMDRRPGDQNGKDGPPPIPEEMINRSLDAMKDKLPRLHD